MSLSTFKKHWCPILKWHRTLIWSKVADSLRRKKCHFSVHVPFDFGLRKVCVVTRKGARYSPPCSPTKIFSSHPSLFSRRLTCIEPSRQNEVFPCFVGFILCCFGGPQPTNLRYDLCGRLWSSCHSKDRYWSVLCSKNVHLSDHRSVLLLSKWCQDSHKLCGPQKHESCGVQYHWWCSHPVCWERWAMWNDYQWKSGFYLSNTSGDLPTTTL